MADFQPQGQNWSGQNPVIGTGEGEVPLAKPPIADMTMRTMGSDISSMKASGGGEPRPYAPKEVSYSAGAAPMPAAPQPMSAAPQMPQSYSAPAASPQMNFGNIAPVSVVAQAAPAKSGSALFIILAAIITSVGLGAVGYFFVYPQFAAPTTPVVTEQTPATAPAPGTEVSATTTSPATTTAITEPVPPTPAATSSVSTASAVSATPELPTVAAHVSMLKTAADFSAEATLGSITLDAIKNAFTSNPVEVPVLKEVTLKNDSGKVYAFAAIAPLFMPTTFNPSTLALFSPDASFITYTDKTGTWPAIVLELVTGADMTAAKTAIAAIEKNNEYASLFIVDPGTPSTWKDGKVGTTVARYISFSKTGVAFNYTWIGNRLVLSSSYAGAQEIAKRITQ